MKTIVDVSLQSRNAAIDRSAFIYNAISGFLMAFQSVILLMVITRVSDLTSAGIFTIAYANATLCLTAGKYGMRNFQASDVLRQFHFEDYAISRLFSSLLMMVGALIWLFISSITLGYSTEKILIILFMCLFKLVDVVEDVYHGDYQRSGRLDIAAKMLTARLASTLAVFVVLLILSSDLLVSLIASTFFTFIVFVVSIWFVKNRHSLPKGPKSKFGLKPVLQLLIECLPLFLASFLMLYICNAPKYAIDACMTDEVQAIFGFISTPVFVVGLLSGFIYNPLIARLAYDWGQGKKKAFLRETFKQCLIILIITLLCIVAARFLGIPVLERLYNTEISNYLPELLVLVAGGGFYGLIGLFITLVTIVRFQKHLIVSYIVASFLALIFSPWIVQNYGLSGASWEYFILMGALAIIFLIVLLIGVNMRTKNR